MGSKETPPQKSQKPSRKLIIEIAPNGTVYAYMESLEHSERIEREKGRFSNNRYSVDCLDWDCDLSNYEAGYWVFDI